MKKKNKTIKEAEAEEGEGEHKKRSRQVITEEGKAQRNIEEAAETRPSQRSE